ncbi:MAG: nitroreductase/quinone reductase family protein [Gammaproteobacteria bacterium]
MRYVKIVAVLFVVYVGIVILFESLLGYFQPSGGTTLVITTVDEDGNASDRVLSRLDSDGKMYVAVNHWPRAWYRRALAHPEVKITTGGETGDYLAVPASDGESARLKNEHPRGIVANLLMGFAPRYFLRLDPR